LTPICNKSFVGWGFSPDPTGGAYSAPPDPLAVFRGSTSKGRGWEMRRRDGKRREEGRGGSSSFALGRKKVGTHDRHKTQTDRQVDNITPEDGQ